MSFELRLEVPAAQSRRSTSATRSPRSAASRATPAPVMPPPMTRRSSAVPGRAASIASRVSAENGEAIAARSAGRAQLGERRLCLGDLVGAALLARDLERAGGEGERLVAVAPRLAHVGERETRADRARVAQDHLAEHRLAPHGVATEQAREADEERALGGHRIDVIRIELERAVDLRHQAAELEDLGEGLAVEAHELAQVAEEGEVRVGARVVERDGALGERLATVEVRLARLSIDGAAAAFALGARAGGEAGDRVVGGAGCARQAEASECHEEPPGAGGAHGSRDHAYRAARSQLFPRLAGARGGPSRATRVYRPVSVFGHPTASGADGGVAPIRHRRCTRRAMAIFPRKPRRPPGRPVAPEAPVGPSASAARPPSVSEVLRERLGEIAGAAVAPEDALGPALRAILEASRAQAGALCLFDQRHGVLRLVAEIGFSEEGCRRLRNVRRTDPTAWDMPLNGLMNRRAYLIESAARNRYVPRLVENAAAVRTIACLPLPAGPTPVGRLVLVALAPRALGERDVRTLERPLGELAVMIEAVRRRGARGEPVEAPRAPVAAPPPPPLPRPAAAVTELQAEREQLRGGVAARAAGRAVLAAELAARSGETDRLRAALELAAADRARLAADFEQAKRDAERAELLAAALAAAERERARLAAALETAAAERAEWARAGGALEAGRGR